MSKLWGRVASISYAKRKNLLRFFIFCLKTHEIKQRTGQSRIQYLFIIFFKSGLHQKNFLIIIFSDFMIFFFLPAMKPDKLDVYKILQNKALKTIKYTKIRIECWKFDFSNIIRHLKLSKLLSRKYFRDSFKRK